MKKQYLRKPHRIRKKKSILKSRFFWLAILISAVIGGFSYFLVFSSFFEVKEINIFGNDKVKKEEIENLVQQQIVTDFKFFKNKNINLVALGKISKCLLDSFPQIAKVASKKELPGTLEIQVEERQPNAIFKQNENYFFVDKEGVIFEKINGENAQFATIQNTLLNKELKLGEQIAEKEIVSQVINLESKFRNELKIPLKEMIIASEDRLNVKTFENWEVYFNLKDDLNWQFTKLKTILENKVPPEKRGNITYIDLRFENVYIFPENYDE